MRMSQPTGYRVRMYDPNARYIDPNGRPTKGKIIHSWNFRDLDDLERFIKRQDPRSERVFSTRIESSGRVRFYIQAIFGSGKRRRYKTIDLSQIKRRERRGD